VRARSIAVGDRPELLAPFAARFGHATGDGQELLTDIARADNRSLAELLRIAIGNQARSATVAEALQHARATDAIAKMVQSPAIAKLQRRGSAWPSGTFDVPDRWLWEPGDAAEARRSLLREGPRSIKLSKCEAFHRPTLRRKRRGSVGT
jgi:hypothetical protein